VRTIADVIVGSLGLENGQVERAVFVVKFDGMRGTMASRITLPDHIDVTASRAGVLALDRNVAVAPAPSETGGRNRKARTLEMSTSRVPRAVPSGNA
jgi:hypothetical protein